MLKIYWWALQKRAPEELWFSLSMHTCGSVPQIVMVLPLTALRTSGAALSYWRSGWQCQFVKRPCWTQDKLVSPGVFVASFSAVKTSATITAFEIDESDYCRCENDSLKTQLNFFPHGSLDLLNSHPKKSAVEPRFPSMVTPQKWFQEPSVLFCFTLFSVSALYIPCL